MNKLFIISIIVIAGAFALFIGTGRQMSSVTQQVIKKMANETPTPTPLPFAELTIPYLRKQSYASKLGQKSVVSNQRSYTSYLTSYRSDGYRIDGLLTIPNGKKPPAGWPAIVFVHGYIPPKQYQTLGAPYRDYVDYLARNGFVVFKIDLRGHGESEGDPGGAYYSADYVVDTLNAYAALQASNEVNPQAIGLWGHSMAGNVVMRATAVHLTIPATVIWAGAVYTYEDFSEYRIQDASYVPLPSSAPSVNKRQRISEQMGQPDLSKAFWQQMAPSTYLTDLKGAIQINHAVDDAVVNIGYSRNLNRLLDKTPVPHELHEYPSGGHNISGVSFGQAMENTVRFFKKYLK